MPYTKGWEREGNNLIQNKVVEKLKMSNNISVSPQLVRFAQDII
jgi:hypothetical protein